MNRISRGFHRIGLLILILAMGMSAYFTVLQLQYPSGRELLFSEMRSADQDWFYGSYESEARRRGKVPVARSNPFWIYDDATSVITGRPRMLSFSDAFGWASFGIAAYAACRALGWVVNGFVG